MEQKLLFNWLYTNSLIVKKIVKKMEELGISERVISTMEGSVDLKVLELGKLDFQATKRETFSKDEIPLITSKSDYVIVTFLKSQKIGFYQCIYGGKGNTGNIIDNYRYKVSFVVLEELTQYVPSLEKESLNTLFEDYKNDILQKKDVVSHL